MARSFIGKTIGRYQIVEHLGRGGMAEVYKAYQPALDRYVAIKLMHSFLADDEDFLGRFQREARAIGRLRHPNIVQVHDFDVEDGIYYMVMEFIDGYTLKEKLYNLAASNAILPLDEALRITRDVTAALAYAHKRGMVHRDVKPANIMINREHQVILTDFGIAKILSGPQYTASGAMIGTPAYMSPEQGMGEPGDARSDIYSLGIVLFQMATGQLPYDADTPLAIVLKHVNSPLPIPSKINPALPSEVERIILKTLAKNPDDRHQSGDELIQHLDLIQESISALPAGPVTETSVNAAAPQQATIIATETPPPGTDQARSPAPQPPPGIQTPPPPGPTTPPPLVHSPSPGQTAAAPGIPTPPPLSPAVAAPATRVVRPRWLFPVSGLGALAVIALLVAFGSGLWGGTGKPTIPTETATRQLAALEGTSTQEPTATEEPEGLVLGPLPATQTAVALQNASLTARALANTPTPTASSTRTPTPSATPTPLPTFTPSPSPTARCEYAYEVEAYYTFRNPANYNRSSNQTSGPANSRFPLTLQLTNQGNCAWPAGTELRFADGESFDMEGSISLAEEVEIGTVSEFETTMTTGSEAGLFVSTWLLQLPDGTVIGDPIELRFYIYLPVTSTPTTPPQPTDTPTPEGGLGPIDFNFFVHDCEYAGDEWRCWMTLTPFGGIGQPYTFWVFDIEPPARYYGGNIEHVIHSRRCFPWIHEIKCQDDGGNSISKNIAIDPDSYFPGGCVEP